MINSDDHIDSKITIGGYDSQKYGAEGSELNWHPLKPKDNKFNHWRIQLESLYFGDHELEDSEIESQICELTKDILFIYSQKKEELEYLDYLSNDFEARESHEQEYRESMIEQFRGCD